MVLLHLSRRGVSVVLYFLITWSGGVSQVSSRGLRMGLVELGIGVCWCLLLLFSVVKLIHAVIGKWSEMLME